MCRCSQPPNAEKILMTFYVHIVESLAPEEMLYDFAPGRALTKYLRLCGIPYQYNNAIDVSSFTKALDARILEGIRDHGVAPIVHLAMHGSEQGVQLTTQRASGNIFSWNQLSQFLLPIHEHLNRQLVVCMSSCSGMLGHSMANIADGNQVPFQSLLGFGANIDWRDLALAYSVFYRRLQAGDDSQNIVNAVQLCSGQSDFGIVNGELAHRVYAEIRAKQDLEKLRHSLQNVTRNL